MGKGKLQVTMKGTSTYKKEREAASKRRVKFTNAANATIVSSFWEYKLQNKVMNDNQLGPQISTNFTQWERILKNTGLRQFPTCHRT